jgi:1-acyl-sn-glycerol-3-phosphate acyltransferase
MRPALSAPESVLARWGRRALTVPGTVLIAAGSLVLLPILLPLAAFVDRLRGSRYALARTLLAFALYLWLEALGLAAAGTLWLARPLAGGRYEAWNLRLQSLWASSLFAGVRRVFGLHLEVSGEEALGPGAILLLPRHVSMADTLLPAALVARHTGRRLRTVMKRELLWDPCLDVMGQRLPNAFVRRGTGDAAETDLLRDLARDLAPDEGVVLYPEGTRFTPARRSRMLDRLARSAEPKLLERAQALQWLLPPRLGGVLALLESAPHADVVFCAHTGFEGVRSLADLWAGALIGRRIRVDFWRVLASSIPRDPKARREWIYDQWARLDAWLEAHAVREAP